MYAHREPISQESNVIHLAKINYLVVNGLLILSSIFYLFYFFNALNDTIDVTNKKRGKILETSIR